MYKAAKDATLQSSRCSLVQMRAEVLSCLSGMCTMAGAAVDSASPCAASVVPHVGSRENLVMGPLYPSLSQLPLCLTLNTVFGEYLPRSNEIL